MGYPTQMKSTRAGFSSLGAGQGLGPPFMQYPTSHMEVAPLHCSSHHYYPFQFQARLQLNPTLGNSTKPIA